MAQLPASLGAGQLDEADHLEDEHHVSGADVPAQSPRLLSASVKRDSELTGLAGEPPEGLGGRERPGNPLSERLALPIHHAMQAVRVRPPRVAVVGERGAQVLDVAGEPVARELAKQLLLARIAAVERTDPHAGFPGHVGDRRRRVGEEDRARGGQDAPIVARRLGPPSAEGYDRGAGIGLPRIIEPERTVPF